MALTGLALAVPGVFAGALSRQLASECAAWTPWLIERLIRRAVRGLPPEHRSRFEEEWRSHVSEIPGNIGRLIVAFGLRSAARKMSSQLASGSEPVIGDVTKRILDLGVGAALLLFVSPLIIATTLLLWVDDQGPVLCWEERIGLNGRIFWLLKFRSGPAKGAKLKDGRNTQSRLSGLVRFVSAIGLNELPQVINILRGEMSFIGPRPRRPEVVTKLAKAIPHYHDRHTVRPGITGWAQISPRNNRSAADEISCDLYYIRNRRTALDLTILARTVRIVLWPHSGDASR